MVAGACNHPNLLVLPFSVELIRAAAQVPHEGSRVLGCCRRPPAPKAGVPPLGSPSFSILLLKEQGTMYENVAPHAWSPLNFLHSEREAKHAKAADICLALEALARNVADPTEKWT
jgi:hypothetical protein